MAGNLECRIAFHGRNETLQLVNEFIRNRFPSVRAEYEEMVHWKELPTLGGGRFEKTTSLS